MILIRPAEKENDYVELVQWWKAHNWEGVPQAVLPKFGAMAYLADDNGLTEMNLACAWLYMDNSVGVCWMEWLVSNPKATGFQTVKCIKSIIQYLGDCAKEMDYGVMLTTCRQPTLAKTYSKSGFKLTDEGMIHMAKILNTGKT